MRLSAPEARGWWERVTTVRRSSADRVEAPRWTRRIAAVAAVLGYGVLMAVLESDLPLPDVPAIVLIVVLLVGWATSVYVVYEFRRRLANAPDAALDEREVRVRDRAYLQAHRIGTAVLFLAGLVGGPLLSVTDTVLSAGLVVDVTFSLAMGLLVLPAAVVAWTEPEDDLDPDELGAVSTSTVVD